MIFWIVFAVIATIDALYFIYCGFVKSYGWLDFSPIADLFILVLIGMVLTMMTLDKYLF